MNESSVKIFSHDGLEIVTVNGLILPKAVVAFCMFRIVTSFPDESSGCPGTASSVSLGEL